MNIRIASESDLKKVLTVEKQAFGDEEGPEIVDLVSALLNDGTAKPVLSLIAENESGAIGHILFTNAGITLSEDRISASILAPLAVIPDSRGQGVGGRLIEEGLRRLTASGVDLVFVLGHPGYYPRHGFQPAGVLGFEAPYPIPEEHADAWMVQALREGVLGKAGGEVVCADALNAPRLWRE